MNFKKINVQMINEPNDHTIQVNELNLDFKLDLELDSTHRGIYELPMYNEYATLTLEFFRQLRSDLTDCFESKD